MTGVGWTRVSTAGGRVRPARPALSYGWVGRLTLFAALVVLFCLVIL